MVQMRPHTMQCGDVLRNNSFFPLFLFFLDFRWLITILSRPWQASNLSPPVKQMMRKDPGRKKQLLGEHFFLVCLYLYTLSEFIMLVTLIRVSIMPIVVAKQRNRLFAICWLSFTRYVCSIMFETFTHSLTVVTSRVWCLIIITILQLMEPTE